MQAKWIKLDLQQLYYPIVNKDTMLVHVKVIRTYVSGSGD